MQWIIYGHTHTHTHTYVHERKCLAVKYILAQGTSKRKVEESETYWGVVCSFPVVSPLSKPHPHQAQTQTPNPLCASLLSLFLFLSTPFFIAPRSFLVTFFFPLSHNLFTVSLSLSAVLITLAVPPVRPTSPACLCLLAEMTISVFNTGAWLQQTNYSNHRSYTTGAQVFLSKLSLSLCPWSNTSSLTITYTKAPRACRTLVVSELAIKKHTRKPYGVSKVSMLWSPIDTRHCPYTRCLPSPVAGPLNIENDVAYSYCH